MRGSNPNVLPLGAPACMRTVDVAIARSEAPATVVSRSVVLTHCQVSSRRLPACATSMPASPTRGGGVRPATTLLNRAPPWAGAMCRTCTVRVAGRARGMMVMCCWGEHSLGSATSREYGCGIIPDTTVVVDGWIVSEYASSTHAPRHDPRSATAMLISRRSWSRAPGSSPGGVVAVVNSGASRTRLQGWGGWKRHSWRDRPVPGLSSVRVGCRE